MSRRELTPREGHPPTPQHKHTEGEDVTRQRGSPARGPWYRTTHPLDATNTLSTCLPPPTCTHAALSTTTTTTDGAPVSRAPLTALRRDERGTRRSTHHRRGRTESQSTTAQCASPHPPPQPTPPALCIPRCVLSSPSTFPSRVDEYWSLLSSSSFPFDSFASDRPCPRRRVRDSSHTDNQRVQHNTRQNRHKKQRAKSESPPQPTKKATTSARITRSCDPVFVCV